MSPQHFRMEHLLQIPAAPQSRAEIDSYLAAFTNYERLGQLPQDRRELGPARARALLDRLGLPSDCCKIQIAGSKGKGSTVFWLEAALLARGLKPGAYCSPHLIRLEERIRVSGQESKLEDLLMGLQAIDPHLRSIAKQQPQWLPTFFDIWTVLASWVMREYQCTHQLYEVGLGGPLDSTSAFEHQMAILTTVDLEHCEQLGDSLEEIALEKSRIARKGCPFILSDPEPDWAGLARQQVKALGALSIDSALHDPRIPSGVVLIQQQNLRAALCALEKGLQLEPFDQTEVAEICDSIVLPARLERMQRPDLLLDAAHTLAAIRAFAQEWKRYRGDTSRPACLLLGFVEGKNWQDCLRELCKSCEQNQRWICTVANDKRALAAEEIAEFIRQFGFSDVQVMAQADQAARQIYQLSRSGWSVGATGSFYLAGTVKQLWLQSSISE